MEHIKLYDTVLIEKGCIARAVMSGRKATISNIEYLGKEYSHMVKVVLHFPGNANGVLGRSITFWARNKNRLTDEIINLNDGNPLHKIKIKRA